MLLSAEVRWFWKEAPPADFQEWFCGSSQRFCIAGGGGTRIDSYLWDPGQVELGIKLRGSGGGVEVKGLVELSGSQVSFTSLTGGVEFWCKWRTDALSLSCCRVIGIKKVRWLRKFELKKDGAGEIELDASEKPKNRGVLPMTGCNVELACVRDEDARAWWSIGFEAFGPRTYLEKALRTTVMLMSERGPPALPVGFCASYPKWLSEKQHL
jgi:hypothetical protein